MFLCLWGALRKPKAAVHSGMQHCYSCFSRSWFPRSVTCSEARIRGGLCDPSSYTAWLKNSPGDFALPPELPKYLNIQWSILFLSVSLLCLLKLLWSSIYWYSWKLGSIKKKKGISLWVDSLLRHIHGRAPVKTRASCIQKGHEFNLSYTVSFKQVKCTKEQEETTSSRNIFSLEATSTTGREAKAIKMHILPKKNVFYSE